MLVKKISLAPSVNVSGLTRRALRESVVLPLNNPHATKLANPRKRKKPAVFPDPIAHRRVGGRPAAGRKTATNKIRQPPSDEK